MNLHRCLLIVVGLACASACSKSNDAPGTNDGNNAGAVAGDGAGGGGSSGTNTSGDPNTYPPGVTAPTTPGGQPVDDGVIPKPNRTDWLKIQGNQFIKADGSVWQGRGVTLHDTRSCDYCTSRAPNLPELKRRVDAAVNEWHVNFIRLMLQSFPAAAYVDANGGARVQWATLLADPNYLHDIQEIVGYIGTKPGVFVEVALWKDPGFTEGANPKTAQGGLPTAATNAELVKLTTVFANDAHVMFGVANEPEQYEDALQPACVSAMSAAVKAIRDQEAAMGTPQHIVAVQGTQGWARLISYYVDHPVAGTNVAYETHPYTPTGNFATNVFNPAKKLPVIIGEFAPSMTAGMTLADCQNMMQQADAANVPWAAWDFHTNCNSRNGDNMLLQTKDAQGAEYKCVYGVPLVTTTWGQAVHDYIRSKQ